MAERPAARLAHPGVRLADVSLHHALFTDRYLFNGEWERGDEYAGFSLGLQVVRTSPLHLSVALTLSSESGLPFDLAVTYAAHFRMEASVPAGEREGVWREVAFQQAPDLVFPYIRELVSNLTCRWGEAPLILPAAPELLGLTREGLELPPAPAHGGG